MFSRCECRADLHWCPGKIWKVPGHLSIVLIVPIAGTLTGLTVTPRPQLYFTPATPIPRPKTAGVGEHKLDDIKGNTRLRRSPP